MTKAIYRQPDGQYLACALKSAPHYRMAGLDWQWVRGVGCRGCWRTKSYEAARRASVYFDVPIERHPAWARLAGEAPTWSGPRA